MDIELFKISVTVAQALTAIFAAVIAVNSFRIARRSLEQTEQNVYLKLYELVQNHHSQEVTDLRACIYTPDNKSKLAEVAAAARSSGKTLREQDREFHAQVSALANYYESVGMFLQYGWDKMPTASKTMMLAMLHNSVTKTWSEIDAYKDAIYPNKRARDWAQSFQWLHARVEEYRREHSLA